MNRLPIYLDACATTVVDRRVLAVMLRVFREEFGNAGSAHVFGRRAKARVHHARDQVAQIVGARRHEVIFTSGATEANNLALLGLAEFGERSSRRHLVSTRIEHKAVLEPLEELARRGFEVTLVPPNTGGWVCPDAVAAAVRPDTLLVSVMQVNNETGIRQPIEQIATRLGACDAYLHVDAAQGFGKELKPLRHPRIDLISVSGHKVFGPQGVGALVARRRARALPPLRPLAYGGGQEFGLRPGTLPVALIAGLGKAAELAGQEAEQRAAQCSAFRAELLEALAPLQPALHGDQRQCLPHVVSLSFPGLDAELAMEALQPFVAVSDGAACTSICSTASHVLAAMQLPAERAAGAIRFSWSHDTTHSNWSQVVRALEGASRP